MSYRDALQLDLFWNPRTKKVQNFEDGILERKLRQMKVAVGNSRWNGFYKYRTKNCDDCSYHLEVDKDELCLVGMAWKRLIQVKKPRKCQYVN